ncbi:MAG: hypothetical protein KKI08_00230 [Armatimonadetes bacterium]|nr:hypothetical protein [Armatimonadota bacterium]
MRIGYLLEGSTDGAVIAGLRDQLCPEAELIEGSFRGSLGPRRRELPKALRELALKGADVIVNLNDANELTWTQRCQQEREWAPVEHHHHLVCGAPEPNVESWLVADAEAFTTRTGVGCRPKPLDAKPLVERGFQVNGFNKRTEEIAAFVRQANFQVWESNDNSFRGFIRECRSMARQCGCELST